MFFTTSLIAATAAFFAVAPASAHMLMLTPHPYGPKSLTNGPLENNLADFPCKQRPDVYGPPAQENVMAIGEQQTLSFLGSAVHGGGSCQVSLTTDMKPTKDSVWKVIHSIEGGCPANTDGNLPEDPNGTGASKFNFKIPSSIAPGEYTLAWTWINRIGNREFYMNCAPIKVTGSKKRYVPTPAQEPRSLIPLAKREDFPPMFVANINECTTPEGVDIRFPQPGSSVERRGNAKNLMASGKPVCMMKSGKPGPMAPADGAAPSADGNDGTAPAKPSQSAEPSKSAPPSNAPGVFLAAEPSSAPTSAVQSSAPSAPTGVPAAPAPAAPSHPPSNLSGSPPSNPSPPTGGSGSAGPCSQEGTWNCIGGTSFQRCASGQWSASIPLASGMKCVEGVSNELKFAPTKRMAHLHRRHGKGSLFA